MLLIDWAVYYWRVGMDKNKEEYDPENDDDIDLEDTQVDDTVLDKALGYKKLNEEYEKQQAHWQKGQYVTLTNSYANKNQGYNGMVGEVVEDDTFAGHLGYIIIKILSNGKWKDKNICIEWMDVRKSTEQEIVKHMVIDAL